MNLLLYGLQRSGTNYLEKLLKKKYRVRFLNDNRDRSLPLQKHFRLYDEKNIIPEPKYYNNFKVVDFNNYEQLLRTVPDYYLIISKDPYSWLLSYRKWGKRCNWPDVSHHYIEEYNLFYGKWLEFSEQTNKIIFVRYIDLLQDPDQESSYLESKMLLTKRWQLPLRSNSISKVPYSKRFSDDRRDYYLNEVYMKDYTKETLHEINELVETQVISSLGYQKKTN